MENGAFHLSQMEFHVSLEQRWIRLKFFDNPSCGFLAAKRGSRPSWLWSSLLHGCVLLLQGVRWQGVRLYHKGEWNYELLCCYISKEEANIIRKVLISQAGSLDKLVWHFDAKAIRVLSIVATTCWCIWKSRNSFIYENVALSPTNTLASIYAQLAEFDKLVTCNPTPITSLPTTAPETSYPSPQWIPPHEPLVKINCDAAFKDNSAAFGIVVRDCVGSLLNVHGNTCFALLPYMLKL
ncbi:hypothetical protein Tco_0597625 [Tanacetum coccineum]